jgi:hypothetical protein
VSIEATSAINAAAQVGVNPTEVSFSAVLDGFANRPQLSALEAGQRNTQGAARAALDRIISDQRRLDNSARTRQIEHLQVVGTGNAPEAFSANPTGNLQGMMNQAMNQTAELFNHMFRLQIIHKGVSSFNKVWETLSKGQ